MAEADRIAEQFQTLDGYRLADYRAVALPYYIVYVDAVVLDRRPLPAVTEFTLRSISIGLKAEQDIRGFLGIEERFFRKLIEDLCGDRYIAREEDGTLVTLAKGIDVLSNCFDAVPLEREIPIVWDLMQRKSAGYLESLVREVDAKRDGLLLIRARPMRAPLASEIPLHAVQEAWVARQRASTDNEAEVIRIRETKRRLLRYRPAVGLVYTQEKGSGVRVRFAVNGRIDDAIGQGFAEQNGPVHMEVTSEFAKRATTLSIRTRLKELPGEVVVVSGYASLLQKRAIARLGIEGLQRRLEEDDEENLIKRLEEKQQELAGIDVEISNLPLRELMPYEVIQLTRDAFQHAEKRVVITTRIPSRERLTSELLSDMAQAAKRGVKVSVFLSGRIPDEGSEGKKWSAISELNRLVNKVPSVEVAFLLEMKRSIFEVSVDDTMILVCNRPPLGDASNSGAGFHPFAGFVISDKLAIRAYRTAHLADAALQVTERLVNRIPGKPQKPHPRVVQRREMRRPRGRP